MENLSTAFYFNFLLTPYNAVWAGVFLAQGATFWGILWILITLVGMAGMFAGIIGALDRQKTKVTKVSK